MCASTSNCLRKAGRAGLPRAPTARPGPRTAARAKTSRNRCTGGKVAAAILDRVLHLYSFANSFGRPAFVFFHFVTALALVGLVLMHSGRASGVGGRGYVSASE